MGVMLIDPVAYLQARYIRLFMKRHNLNPQQFLALNKKKDVIDFLRLGYESFHLTGDEGVLQELDLYVYES